MRFQGVVYRAHNPRWSWNPLSGEGARLYGGRFNRRGVPALYTSLAPLTAVREAALLGRPMQPITLCAYEVDAEPVFDASDKALCRSLDVSDSDIASPSWRAEMLAGAVSTSQGLADRLIAAGYVGMRVRSFAPATVPDDVNLVLWTWGPERPSRAVLIDEEGRLPGLPFRDTPPPGTP